jgi:hypothetical protein
MRGLTLVVVLLGTAVILGGPTPGHSQQQASEEQLRRELDALKQQLQRVEQQMKQQEELIQKLSGEKPGPPAAPSTAPAAPPATTPSAAEPAKPAPAPMAVDAEELKRMILAEIQPQLAAANKTFPAQFNPAIGFIVDSVFSYSRNNRSNFEFRSGELGISASVDPFARGYAIINGTADGVEVEEAAIVTTALPYNLTVKGGRFFAEFGRLSTFHDHDLPFVNRPLVLDQYIGGESQADGVEVNWLAPIDQYLTFTAGFYNKIGADNDRVDNLVPRDLSEFTYLARVATYFSLSDSLGLDLGLSDAYTPEVRIEGLKPRNVFGFDMTLRYAPLGQSSYRGFIWGSELLVNHEARPGIPPTDDSPNQVFRYRDAVGAYSYFEARLTRRYYPGILLEYVQDIDNPARTTWQISPYFTLWASEFQRIRLQYTHTETSLPSSKPTDDAFFLQWTIVMGSHVHGFRDR